MKKEKMDDDFSDVQPFHDIKIGKRGILWISAVLLIGLIFICGKYHFIYSSEKSFLIIPKISFSLPETYVNLDAVLNMPRIVAMSRYPLAFKALQNEGIIESDEHQTKRINDDIVKKTRDLLEQISK